MSNPRIYELMMEFLKTHYPITRVKIDGRFKRGIMIEGHAYMLRLISLSPLDFELFTILDTVFSVSAPEIYEVLAKYLNKTNIK